MDCALALIVYGQSASTSDELCRAWNIEMWHQAFPMCHSNWEQNGQKEITSLEALVREEAVQWVRLYKDPAVFSKYCFTTDVYPL